MGVEGADAGGCRGPWACSLPVVFSLTLATHPHPESRCTAKVLSVETGNCPDARQKEADLKVVLLCHFLLQLSPALPA